jgi:membrane-associated phospholipid phosphatase
VFAIYLFISVSLWCSTVYLRHHWVVDLLAGFFIATLAGWAAPWIRRVWPSTATAEP